MTPGFAMVAATTSGSAPHIVPHLIRVVICLDFAEKTGTSHGIDAIGFGKRPFRPPFHRLRRYRSSSVRDHGFHGINISSDVHRSPQRRGFIEQPIDPGLLELLLAFSLFAFDLQLAITSILLELCLASLAPLKCVDTAFAVADLGRRDHFHSDLLNETLKAAPFPVLPGRPLLIAPVSGENGKAQLIRTADGLGSLAPPRRRPTKREGHAGLMNDYADLPRFPAPHFRLAAASGHRQEKRVEEPEPSLLKWSIKNRRVPRKRVGRGRLLLPAVIVLGNEAGDGGMSRCHHLANADLADDFPDPIADQR
jgi:hypothetical protein